MLDASTPWLTAIVVLLTLGSTLSLALRRQKSDAEMLFAVFCGSLAISMLRPWLAQESGWLWWALAVGSCATCNGYWLVARALFRGDGAVGRVHIAVALGIALMIVGGRVASASDALIGHWLAIAIGALLSLASSAVLALAFLEALRGWSAPMPLAERRLRSGFMLVFGGCVTLATVIGGLAEAVPALKVLESQIEAACALAIVVFTQWAIAQRRRQPWPMAPGIAEENGSRPSTAMPSVEQRLLADAILRLLNDDEVYREPELKVADLAERLGSAEHKVSRAITQALGERNFNALVNRYRIAYACRALSESGARRTVLEISLDAGFASLGPFNRAFKAATGSTPSAYREAASGQGASAASAQPTAARTDEGICRI